MTHSKALVFGGTGRTGSRIVRHSQHGGRQTRIASRQGESPFSREDRATWERTDRDAPAVGTAVRGAAIPDAAIPGLGHRESAAAS
ncbi:NAD(P)-dependent oxidoreductase [Arthrobacter antibioticus]|uniref:hypothetical protein n=1 Tax=Arthrobacter sp. H35-MC1 TaxID=3046203 RepID=UPI0024BAE3AC|nr:hypothetical protein [Arthrobacter sp. H35-MC1]MDJ0316330.1 hypothetical protein [Arthrobacter sp. H35-MC1]